MKKIMIISILLVGMLVGCQSKQKEVNVTKQDIKHGYVDQNGYIEVRKNDKSCMMDMEGTITIPCDYEFVYRVDQFYFIGNEDVYGVVDKNHTTRLPLAYGRIAYVKDTHSFFARDKGNTIMFDEEGNKKKTIDGELAKLKFDSKLLFVDKDGKRAMMNTEGEFLTEFIYDTDTWFPNIQTYEKNYISVASKNGKAGILNQNGKEVIDFIYDYIHPISKYKDVYDDSGYTGYFQAVKNGKSGIIDINGNVIVDFLYDAYLGKEDTGDNKVSYRTNTGFHLRRNGYEVFVDMKGKEIIDECVQQASLNVIRDDENGFSICMDGKTTYYDLHGNVKFVFDGFGDPMEDGVSVIHQANGSIIINEQEEILYKSDNVDVERIGNRFLDGNHVIDTYGKEVLSVDNAQVVYIKVNDTGWLAVESKKQDSAKPMTTLYDMDGKKVMDIHGVVSSINLNPFNYETITIYDKHDIKSKKGLIQPNREKEVKPIYKEIIEKDDYYCAYKQDGTSVLLDKETLEVVLESKEKIYIY